MPRFLCLFKYLYLYIYSLAWVSLSTIFLVVSKDRPFMHWYKHYSSWGLWQPLRIVPRCPLSVRIYIYIYIDRYIGICQGTSSFLKVVVCMDILHDRVIFKRNMRTPFCLIRSYRSGSSNVLGEISSRLGAPRWVWSPPLKWKCRRFEFIIRRAPWWCWFTRDQDARSAFPATPRRNPRQSPNASSAS